MRKLISFFLLLIIIFSSALGFAANGDIIHTGLKKIYRAGTSEITEDLIDDIINGVDQSKFYRELDGRYINVKDEENAHINYLSDLMAQEGLTTPEALEQYLMNNYDYVKGELNRISGEISKDFEDIRLSPKDKIEDFHNSSSALRLTSVNFSSPEPGSQVGSIKISTLNLPRDSFKWKINISQEKILDIKRGSLVSNPIDYIAHRDIPIKSGEYLNLYAVDRQDKIIAFASMEILEDMIRKAKIYAEELKKDIHYIGPEPGEKVGTTRFKSMDFQGMEADKWNIFTSNGPISKPELNSLALGTDYNPGDDIEINPGDRILLTATKDNKIKAYGLIYIGIDDIKVKEDEGDGNNPLLLQAGTHYSPLIKGSTVGSTRFPWVNPRNLGEDIVWRYVISSKNIPIPVRDSMIEDEEFDVKVLGENREITVATEEEILSIGTIDKNLMLIATLNSGDDYKIKAYALLKANTSNVAMPKAKKLEKHIHYSTPIKGSGEYTTKIESLNTTDITEFNQWRYKLADERIDNIEFNSVFSNSSFYREGMDIPNAKDGDYLILAATDGYSRLKMYSNIELKESMIRNKNADLLISPANYNANDPSPGSKEGSTRFNTLSFSTNIKSASQWMIDISDSSFGPIEMDSPVDGARNYVAGQDIENVSINDHILLLATDNQGNVKGFAEFRLMEENIKGGEPTILSEGTRPGSNYVIERGNTPGTTRFVNLKFDGVFGGVNWKYKWMENKLSEGELPYFNQVVANTEYYSVFNSIGEDIPVSWVSTEDKYGYILLLAVDNYGKTKGYSLISVDSAVVKEHAPQLSDDIKLIPGDTTDKVKFTGLDIAARYMYVLGDFQYTTPALDDILYYGEVYKEDITVIIGQHLTLFKVDSENKIQGFKRFLVRNEDIKQGSAHFGLIDSDEAWVPEGSIVNGGTGIKITLTDAEWADIINDKSIRDEFFSGFKPNRDANQWFNVITRLISDGGGISIDGNTLSFYLPNTPGYNISEDQEITFTIPPVAIKGAINPIESSGSIVIKPTIDALVSGDVIGKVIREKDLKNGGVDIVITLLDGDWVGSINKNTLIERFKGGDNWYIIKDEYIENGSLTRNSSKKLTLTLPPVSVNLGGSREDISVIIPKELIQGATGDVVASPIFSIYPDVLKVEAELVEDNVTMQAPDGRDILEGHNNWKIKLNNSSFIDDLTGKDIVIGNLPRGLSYKTKRIDNQYMNIELSGMASEPIVDEMDIILRIKASAVKEPNSQDSDNIVMKIKVNEAEDFQGVAYKIEDGKIYLTVPENLVDRVEYSINSTNGINGNWAMVRTDSQLISSSLAPVKVWLRETHQPKVFTKAMDLGYALPPEAIIIKDIDYREDNGDIVKDVTLEGIDNTMEYSPDGGNSWPEPISDPLNPITLDEASDLRIRIRAVTGPSGELPSLATKRLNGLFLGNASLEVGEGKIAYTNTSMEYSLDSTNGVDGQWQRANAGETMINFVRNNRVWIREGKSSINFRKLGEVAEKSKPILYDEDNEPLIEYNILEKTLENKTDEVLEYKMPSGNWHILAANTLYDNVEFTSGDLDIRTRGDKNTLPSPGITFISIAKPMEPPELKGDDDSKLIYYFDGIWKELDGKFEYKIGSNGIWTSGEGFSEDNSRNESVIVYVRKKASEKILPSMEKPLSFTRNLGFENVRYNVEKKLLEGVNSKIEYSRNSSDKKNGIWKAINGTSINIEPFEGMYLWIREVNKASTEQLLVKDLARWGQPQFTKLYYNIETNKIANQTLQNLEYKIANGQWMRIDSQSDAYGVEFKPGRFEFRQRATEDKMASQPRLRVIIKSKLSGPNIEFSDIHNRVESINGTNSSEWKKYEYRIDPISTSPWMSAELLAGEDLTGDKVVEIRIKADRNTLSSQITTILFRENLELKKVTLSQHINPHVLNGTTPEMEYQIYLNNEERTGWVQCDNENTTLPSWLKANIDLDNVDRIEIRDGREGLHNDVHLIYKK